MTSFFATAIVTLADRFNIHKLPTITASFSGVDIFTASKVKYMLLKYNFALLA